MNTQTHSVTHTTSKLLYRQLMWDVINDSSYHSCKGCKAFCAQGQVFLTLQYRMLCKPYPTRISFHYTLRKK